MKNLKHTFTLLLATLLIVSSCTKNDDEVDTIVEDPINPPTAADFKAIQEDAFNNLIQTASFNAEDGITFVSDAGTTLTIWGDCLSLNGDQVTGPVDLEFVEVYEKGNMITTNATTVGKYQSGELEQLISGGEFHIKAFQNGEELTTDCGMMIDVPVDITGGVVPGMGPFVGEIDENDNLVWLPQNTEFWLDEQDGVSYSAFIENFGWFNCDVFVSDPDPKTEIQIAVPQGFDNGNSSIYFARAGESNSLAFLYGEFPIGLEAHIIFLSEHNGDFRYAIQSITVEEDQEVIFTIEETEVAPVDDVIDIINDLP